MNDLKEYIDSLKGNLPIDDKNLIDNKSVRQEMETQWDSVFIVPIDSLDDKKEMWQNISAHIHSNKTGKRANIFKIYGIAATILLFIVSGSLFLRESRLKESHIYVICTGNQDKNILTLGDGTKIKLGAGSRLTYPEEFPQEKRYVQLEGQAFFDVAKDTERPFTVEMGNVVVTALGTSFEVFHDKHNNAVETILLTGKVKVEYKNTTSGNPKSDILYPNQKLTVSLSTGEVSIKEENVNKYSAWRNYNGLDFTDEKLSVIIPRLEYWYGCDILYDSDDISDERFTFKVKNESLDRILELIYQSASIEYKKNEDNTVYTLYRKK
jgi:ferric-dicitrate binding protein FerR (iron transport regulator)